ncbi:MAG: hypothetical protein WCD18_23460 [Thermosynechococcaceae cyanobacterium]
MLSLPLQALLWAIAAFLLNGCAGSLGASSTLVFLSRVCLTLSVIIAPWFLKGLILVTVLVIPTCLQWHSTAQPRCSRLCAARANCPFPKA